MQPSPSQNKKPMTPPVQYKFRLYVAGESLNSKLALYNLSEFCNAHLVGRYSIDVVDVFRDPKRALADGIFLTPTLIKLSPAPVRKIVGTLSNTQVVLIALGLNLADT